MAILKKLVLHQRFLIAEEGKEQASKAMSALKKIALVPN